jgi:hypothetical protein
MRTTVTSWSSTPEPSVTIEVDIPPALRTCAAVASTSCCAVAPFIASSSPRGLNSGRLQAASRSNGGDGPRCYHRHCHDTNELLGPGPSNLDLILQPEVGNDLVQPVDAALQWFNQHHPQVRSTQHQHNARQPRPAAHIGHGAAVSHQVSDDRTVQQMPAPQPGHLSRPDQPSLQPRGRQVLHESHRTVKLVSEKILSSLWWAWSARCGRELRMFHVKRRVGDETMRA